MRHWYTRYRISNAIDHGTLAALLAGGHAGRCPACRAYARDLQALHARLAAGAPSAPAPAPAAPRRARWPLLAAPLALGAAAAIALSLGAREPTAPVVVAPRAPAAPTVGVRDVADRVVQLLASSSAPLDSELHDLIHDGRRGLDAVLATGGLRRR